MLASRQSKETDEGSFSSDNEQTPWKSCCRLCAKEYDDSHICVFPDIEELDNVVDSSLPAVIVKFFRVNMRPNDGLSSFICLECHTLVTSLEQFTERVNKVQAMFTALRITGVVDLNKVKLQYGLIDTQWEHIIKLGKNCSGESSKNTNVENSTRHEENRKRKAEEECSLIYSKEAADLITRICYNCRQPGHFASDCKIASTRHEEKQKNKIGEEWLVLSSTDPADLIKGICYNCRQSGHLARDCMIGSTRHKEKRKYKVVKEGPIISKKFTLNPSQRNCYNCRQSGHIARDCKNASIRYKETRNGKAEDERPIISNTYVAEFNKKICYICRKSGHFARDCNFGRLDTLCVD